ncbi:MAG TPA: hypothetical protein VH374_23670 [Polyangia bacterium]|nr:hypothetical protein [Polyangia bacterium]
MSNGRASTALAAWLVAATFVVAWAPSADGDIWWHLAAGREMVRTHGLLWTDPFSSGAAGRPWVDVHWLFQLLAYAVFAAGGLAALVLAKGVLVAAGAWVLRAAIVDSPAARPAEPLFSVALVAALFVARPLLLVRPVIPTLLLVAIFFRRLEAFRRGGPPRALLWLPLLQILWANLQGLFALGPALVAAYAAGASVAVVVGRRWPAIAANEADRADAPTSATRVRWLAACLALCSLACLLTPYGLRGPLLAWQLLLRLIPGGGNVYSANIAENVPPWSLSLAARESFWHLRWFLTFFAGSFVAARRRLVASHCLLGAALVVLAILANRNILLLYWLGVPIAVFNFAPAFKSVRVGLGRRRRGQRWVLAGAAALPVGLSTVAVIAAIREPTIREAAPWRAPVQSVGILDRQAGPGTIFAADNYGGYLIWRLYPRFRPYMDTRLVLRTADEFTEYLALADDPDSFDAWEQRFHFDYVALPTAYPDRYRGLIAHLYASETWTLIYTDGTETLFARTSSAATPAVDLAQPETTDSILSELALRFGQQPRLHQAARLQLAILELSVGIFAEADRAVAGLDSADADLIRAHSRLGLDDAPGAQAIAEKLLRTDPDDVQALDLLAALALQRGDVKETIAFLKRALAVDPTDADATRMLEQLERRDR